MLPCHPFPHVSFQLVLYPFSTMSTSNAPARTTLQLYNHKNLICPQIFEIHTTLGYNFTWLKEFDLLLLVSMGTFANGIPLLDAIVNSYDNDNLTIAMTVHGKPVPFSIKPFNVHRLIGLPFKDLEEQVNMKVAFIKWQR